MIAVIFEVSPAEGQRDWYLNIASALAPRLTKFPGFVSIERFQSLPDPGKILSLSFWTDEEAVARWRNMALHREAQALGRGSVFKDYRLRVAHVARDYGMRSREQAPSDSKRQHGGGGP